MEIRQISADERTDLMFPLQAYAFEPSPSADEAREAYRRRMEYYGTATSLVAEEDGQVLAGVAALPMQQNVRGVVHDMAGVASVAAHPSARRRGFVRELLQRLMRQMRDQGCGVSALYPFRPSFYGRFGYVGVPRVRKATFAAAGSLAPCASRSAGLRGADDGLRRLRRVRRLHPAPAARAARVLGVRRGAYRRVPERQAVGGGRPGRR